ncbi:hypothetical protein MY11210_005222 [Beauveria gryllotalpidicola]
MTKLSNLFATLLFASNVIAQNGSGSPSNGGGSNDIEAACSTPECFAGNKLTYYVIYSSECTRERYTEEVCLGSDEWCAHSTRLKFYGSKEKCLAVRPKPQGNVPWQDGGNVDCTDTSEQCLGTDAICSSLPNEILIADSIESNLDEFEQRCLDQRSKPGSSSPPSAPENPPKEPEEPPKEPEEPSKEPEEPSKEPEEPSKEPEEPSKEPEEPPKQQQQQPPPEEPFFHLPDSPGCSKPGADEEACLGTMAWCDKQHQRQQQEGGKNACLLARGLDLPAFEAMFQQGLVAPVRESILTVAMNVTRNAALREILLNATVETAQKAMAADLSGFMDKVQGSLERHALEGTRKGLERHAGQKLFEA